MSIAQTWFERVIDSEPTVQGWVETMVSVLREVRRVLRKDGTLWLNLGDSYAGSRCGGHTNATGLRAPGQKIDKSAEAKELLRTRATTDSRRRDRVEIPRSDFRMQGIKPKDIVGQPWRLAFALQDDGWHLRMDIIWNKLNPMPESVTDRPTKAHEYVFLLSKSGRYYYDADAIKEPLSPEKHARYARVRSDDHKNAQVALVPGSKPQTIANGFAHMRKDVAGWAKGDGSHTARDHASPKYDGAGAEHQTKRNLAAAERKFSQGTDAEQRDRGRVKDNPSYHEAMRDQPPLRNKRSVWTLATEGFKGAHFATFPSELITPCILAGCPEGGVVLDPFGGSGTTGVVADRHGRNAVLIDLDERNVPMAEKRIAADKWNAAKRTRALFDDAGAA
jgi:DNA modification methylase